MLTVLARVLFAVPEAAPCTRCDRRACGPKMCPLHGLSSHGSRGRSPFCHPSPLPCDGTSKAWEGSDEKSKGVNSLGKVKDCSTGCTEGFYLYQEAQAFLSSFCSSCNTFRNTFCSSPNSLCNSGSSTAGRGAAGRSISFALTSRLEKRRQVCCVVYPLNQILL